MKKIETVTARELYEMKLPPTRFVVDGLLPKGIAHLRWTAEGRKELAAAPARAGRCFRKPLLGPGDRTGNGSLPLP